MINTQIPPSRSEVEHFIPTVAAEEAVASQPAPADYFLSTIVVVLGIVLGAVAALIIGLCTGWIEFAC